MDTDTDDDVLHKLADGKSMDHEQWPGLLTRLLTRLEKIVQDEFPPLTAIVPSSQPISSSPPPSTQGGSSQGQSTPATSQTTTKPASILPPQLQTLLLSITTNLSTLFTTHPPHTIQRLAELLLRPRQHYRTLPSYLHALDRVVHVTSGAQIFPLPPAIPDPSSLTLLSNGTTVDPLSISWGNPASTPTATALGSDESLGGALLTPITWLTGNRTGSHSPLDGEVKTESTETIDGPNGPGGVETVSVSVNGVSSSTADDLAALRAEGGITQGELLRQEQKAGVVPATQLRENRGDESGMGEEDELPHARGPEEIGSVDMGPQAPGGRRAVNMGSQGIDVEAAVGRRLTTRGKEDEDGDEEMDGEGNEVSTPSTPKREAGEELGGVAKRQRSVEPESTSKSEESKDEDAEVVDADGKAVDEPKTGEKGETKGPDAVDGSTV